MHIAITTRLFFPIEGGVSVYTDILARVWTAAGHEVRVYTSTPNEIGSAERIVPYTLVRCPTKRALWQAAGWADLNFQVEVSAKFFWPFLLRRKSIFVSHHTHYSLGQSPPAYRVLQMGLTYLSHPISVSDCIRRSWGNRGSVIPNPFDHETYVERDTEKTRDLIFAGRLVHCKGVEILLHALYLLGQRNLRPHLAVAGESGGATSAIPSLRALCRELGIDAQVSFLGHCVPHRLAEEMQRSKILVIPSLWPEPFGIVALEGLACGCMVIASNEGGLPDAAGDFSTFTPNGDAAALANALEKAITDPEAVRPEKKVVREHLAKHLPSVIGDRYLQLFEQKCSSHRLANSQPSDDFQPSAKQQLVR